VLVALQRVADGATVAARRIKERLGYIVLWLKPAWLKPA
jgi:hypothetical protein